MPPNDGGQGPPYQPPDFTSGAINTKYEMEGHGQDGRNTSCGLVYCAFTGLLVYIYFLCPGRCPGLVYFALTGQ